MDELYESIILIIQENIPFIVDNSQNIFNVLLSLLISILFVFWLYCPFFIFFDSHKRIKNFGIKLLLFLLGVILGPFFLLIYILLRPRTTFDEEFFLILEKRFLYNEASKVLVCKNCHNYVVEGNLYCTFCGFQNRFHCMNCNSIVDYDDKFCGACGVELKLEQTTSLSSLRPITKLDDHERKLFNLAALYFTSKQKLSDLNKFIICLVEKVHSVSKKFLVGKQKNKNQDNLSEIQDISLSNGHQQSLVNTEEVQKSNTKQVLKINKKKKQNSKLKFKKKRKK